MGVPNPSGCIYNLLLYLRPGNIQKRGRKTVELEDLKVFHPTVSPRNDREATPTALQQYGKGQWRMRLVRGGSWEDRREGAATGI